MIIVNRRASGEYFGLLDQDTASALGPLVNQYSIHLTGFVPIRPQTKSSKSSISRGSHQLCILLYGIQEEIDTIGKLLSSNEIYLQHPQNQDDDVHYNNPHYLTRPGSQIEVPEAVSSSTRRSWPKRDYMADIFESSQGPELYSEVRASRRLARSLKMHQKKGLAMMIEKEAGRLSDNEFGAIWQIFRDSEGQERYRNVVTGVSQKDAPPISRGGLLADDMGLGKTLTVLALIAGTLDNQAPSCCVGPNPLISSNDQNTCKTTLIVAPKSTLLSWDEQIKRHFHSGQINVHLHHGEGRATEFASLQGYDIIITTYETLCAELSGRSNLSSKRRSVLHSGEWFRVVLDEGEFLVHDLPLPHTWSLKHWP